MTRLRANSTMECDERWGREGQGPARGHLLENPLQTDSILPDKGNIGILIWGGRGVLESLLLEPEVT